MAKLYYKFGAMASSKTANALMTKFNYEEKGNKVWLIKPDLDNRDDYVNEQGKKITVVKSRVGLMAEAEAISQTEDLLARFKGMRENAPVDVIICDECQFLAPEQVDQLKHVAEYLDTPVLCFGLRSDFQTKLFPGSMRLFEIADSITEVKSVCRCGKKATVNARLNEKGEVIVEGEQVCIGGNDRYEAMCWGCWLFDFASQFQSCLLRHLMIQQHDINFVATQNFCSLCCCCSFFGVFNTNLI